ncbi:MULTISPECIES: radical SAM family heme chaperone HemW [unclassified Acinetobacter]|uniref:radical SAM family heme chaperone HemW n=1 Tax=unclassified Acinetobacter TaxID=196816 RepID=UPI0024473341|nr:MULTISPECIES: radical SAM family heme chaperone HemW [unclassified Acinetobacter]MDH0031127.1 radical SAM family heme chaperone HemW [Acinetobacter sp. GD04021]MDH0886713.1 radical SAM family heme chaperone HemW [Acinetobacter sp. GD03873]MDH1083154.1 radical SAM family heme chaperone HemW [Acinetobacter sp. GD03983]MDH2189333.1 radical SAM family heme chaperone HemW [Acinetobacter sp. GD03645]MDH2202860.1 radical SAM family heme chaperone HemW [Acinetobacter sp. GD03647]
MSELNPALIPLSLYIHMPWCVRKCPYCDFNSHAVPDGQLSTDLEQQYLAALVADFETQVEMAQGRSIHSVFIGGGTPSLISAQGYTWLFEQLRARLDFEPDCEITLEANPGTVEHDPFADYLAVGINRLSIGVQSFNAEHLQRLGRIHSADNALSAIQQARQAGFERVNVDLMHGLPQQTLEQALTDLKLAVEQGATHISWYQLTIEPNTVFFRTQPVLPQDELLEQIQEQGEAYLKAQGFINYEVSAWRKEQPSAHNLNYWQFGDYLAIGAGAHGKVTRPDGIYRFQKTRLPKDYLAKVPADHLQMKKIESDELPFEFMMNALRLNDGVNAELYGQRTGLELNDLNKTLNQLREKNLLVNDLNRISCTEQGHVFLNSVLEAFL